ncbi:MAG TPA: N-acetylmuramoyl-L-alanine amidase [Saprospiraceae bacterium]|nr:N-acetylmuramoyl-L-alanine amidase [Saprospiraceae bacterium]
MLQIINHKLVNVPYNELPHSNSSLTPKYIAAHYTAGTSINGSISHLRSVGLSYHVIIDRDGSIIQCAPFNKRAGHAGVSNWKGLSDINKHAIGISMANRGYLQKFENGSYGIVNSHNDPIGGFLTEDQVYKGNHFNGGINNEYWEKYTNAQLIAFRDVCQALVQNYSTIKDLVGHDEIAMGRKPDPGPAFPFTDFYPIFPDRNTDLGPVKAVQSSDGSLNVRRGMSGNFKLVRQLNNGDKVHVRSEGYKYLNNNAVLNDWVSISLDGTTDHIGFVNRNFLKSL